jgi:hypothetical protein
MSMKCTLPKENTDTTDTAQIGVLLSHGLLAVCLLLEGLQLLYVHIGSIWNLC